MRDLVASVVWWPFMNPDWSGCISQGRILISCKAISLAYSFKSILRRDIGLKLWGVSFHGFGNVIIISGGKDKEAVAALYTLVKYGIKRCLKVLKYALIYPSEPGDLINGSESIACSTS